MAVTISGSTPTFSAATGYAGGTITSGTAVASTSGTSIDFTSIPSWVKRITVMLNGVSVSGTSSILVQLGTSGGIQNTGYVSAGAVSTPFGTGAATSTAGFLIFTDQASFVLTGNMTINNQTSTTWLSSHTTGVTGVVGQSSGGGVKSSLSGTLDRLRITTVNGTDTFDAGSINILYE
jgi:hypothetical protein